MAMRHETPVHRPYVSPADTLPSADFNFDDLRSRMAAFTSKFDAFIARGRQRVLEERNAFRLSMAELQGTSPHPVPIPNLTNPDSQRTQRAAIDSLTAAAAAHTDTLSREAAETAELEAAIATYNGERDAALARRDRLNAAIAELQSEAATRRAARDAQAR